MSTKPKFSIPPISRDGFFFSGSEFYVEVEHHRHVRCDAPTLYRYLTAPPTTDTTPLLTKTGKVAKQQPKPLVDPPVHFYRAQLMHYGLKPLKTKEPAKKALLAAFASHSGSSSIAYALGTGELAVPDKIRKLEEELREEYRVALAQAEKKYKAEKRKEKREKEKAEKALALDSTSKKGNNERMGIGAAVAPVSVGAVGTKQGQAKSNSNSNLNVGPSDHGKQPTPQPPGLSSEEMALIARNLSDLRKIADWVDENGRPKTSLPSTTSGNEGTPINVDEYAMDVDMDNGGQQRKPLLNAMLPAPGSTTPQPVPTVFQNMPSVTFSVPEPGAPFPASFPAIRRGRKQTARKSTGGRPPRKQLAAKSAVRRKAKQKSTLAKARANSRDGGIRPMSDWSLAELADGLKEIPPSRLHAIIAKFMNSSPAFVDEIRDEIGKQLGAQNPDAPAPSPSIVLDDDIQAVYEVSVPTILREWPDYCEDGMSLSVCLSSTGSHLWCSFDFGMYEGIMRSITESSHPASTEPNKTFRFQWRARDASENIIQCSSDQTCEIVFLPDGRIRGKMFCLWGEECELFGRRIGDDGVYGDEVSGWKAEWRDMNEGQYEVENRKRWGKWVEDARADRPLPSDTSAGEYDGSGSEDDDYESDDGEVDEYAF